MTPAGCPTIWLSSNCLSGNRIRPYRLRVQSHKTYPLHHPPTSDANHKSRLLLCFWWASCRPEVPITPLLSSISFLEWFKELRETFYVLDSVQFSHSVVFDSLQPHRLQHTRPLSPSPTPKGHSNSGIVSQWCHPTISSSVIPFSSCLQSFPASEFFQMSQLFASHGQSIRASASTSVLPMNTQDWVPLGWMGWISLQSKGFSRVFSNTTVQKHQFCKS